MKTWPVHIRTGPEDVGVEQSQHTTHGGSPRVVEDLVVVQGPGVHDVHGDHLIDHGA